MKQDIISSSSSGNLAMEDIYVSSGTINFAFKDENPVDSVRFYKKNNLTGFHCLYITNTLLIRVFLYREGASQSTSSLKIRRKIHQSVFFFT